MSTLTINNSEKILSSNIYITDVIKDNQGNCSYKLHVEVLPFIGYACTVATMGSNCKIITSTFSPYGDGIIFSSGLNPNGQQFESVAVNIPVGIYDCTISLSAVALQTGEYTEAQSAISYSLDTNYYNGIAQEESLYQEGTVPL